MHRYIYKICLLDYVFYSAQSRGIEKWNQKYFYIYMYALERRDRMQNRTQRKMQWVKYIYNEKGHASRLV